MVRYGLAEMLGKEPDLEVVGQAGDGAEAAALTAETSPDVVLLDLRMPAADGLSAIEAIRETDGCSILVLSTYAEGPDVLRALEAGANGYLLKSAPREEIFSAVREAAAGGSPPLAPEVSAALFRQLRQERMPRPSEREVEVLRLASKGLSNKQIAQKLFITESTVKTHFNRIFNKLQVPNRSSAILAAMEQGYLGSSRG